MIAMVAGLVAYYAMLVGIAMLLRRPTATAISWIVIRLLTFVPFAIAGAVTKGDEGFVIAMWGFIPDAPIWPLFSITNHVANYLPGGRLIQIATDLMIYLAWYAGGGYLAARWAQKRLGAFGENAIAD